MFPLHCIPEILYAESIYTQLIIHAKSFPLYGPITLIHNISVMDRWTDEQKTDDNGTIDTYSK